MKTFAFSFVLIASLLHAQQPEETLADMEKAKVRMRVVVRKLTLDGALCYAAPLVTQQGREVPVAASKGDPFAAGGKIGDVLGAPIIVEGMIAPKSGKEESMTLYPVSSDKIPIYASSAALALHMRTGKRRPVTLGMVEQCAFEAKVWVVEKNPEGVKAQVKPRADRKNSKGVTEVFYDFSNDDVCIVLGKAAEKLLPQQDTICRLFPASSEMATPQVFAMSAAEALQIMQATK